ncbi:MAG: hypothetical protein CR959_00175 [Fusobacteriales bacterium]|nr:MAG: hypothetical protein CR959_00175 [Fusobacteriales bacterium]
MKKIFKIAILITLILSFIGCGNTKPEVLDEKFIGTYVSNLNNYKEIAEINLVGNDLFLDYTEIDINKDNLIVGEAHLKIENALFVYDKKRNTYTLKEDLIQNVEVSKTKVAEKNKEESNRPFKEFIENVSVSNLECTIRVNKDRNANILDFGNGCVFFCVN